MFPQKNISFPGEITMVHHLEPGFCQLLPCRKTFNKLPGCWATPATSSTPSPAVRPRKRTSMPGPWSWVWRNCGRVSGSRRSRGDFGGFQMSPWSWATVTWLMMIIYIIYIYIIWIISDYIWLKHLLLSLDSSTDSSTDSSSDWLDAWDIFITDIDMLKKTSSYIWSDKNYKISVELLITSILKFFFAGRWMLLVFFFFLIGMCWAIVAWCYLMNAWGKQLMGKKLSISVELLWPGRCSSFVWGGWDCSVGS